VAHVVCAHGGSVRRGAARAGADVAHDDAVHLQLRLDSLERVPLPWARRGHHRVHHAAVVPRVRLRVAAVRPKSSPVHSCAAELSTRPHMALLVAHARAPPTAPQRPLGGCTAQTVCSLSTRRSRLASVQVRSSSAHAGGRQRRRTCTPRMHAATDGSTGATRTGVLFVCLGALPG
jgi:hypothetical protein